MEERDKHNGFYSPSDIRQYIDGKLSAVEMHAMEKAALDDPFLADALEGIAGESDNSFQNASGTLKKRLLERVNQPGEKGKLITLLLRWQTAAAVLLLVFSAYISYIFLIKKPAADHEMAVKQIQKRRTDSSVQKTVPAAPAPSQPESERAPVANDAVRTLPVAGRQIPARNKKTAVKKEDEASVNLNRAAEIDTEAEPAAIDKRVSTDTFPAPEKSKNPADAITALEGRSAGVVVQDKARRLADPTRKNYLEGIVTDSNGNPISSATVSLKNKNTRVTTNSNGFFKLKTDSRDSSQDVVISSVGYQAVTQSLPLDADKKTMIRMPGSGNNLNEVAVTALGIRERKKGISRENKLAEPAGGRDEFNRYLNKNKKIISADSSLQGEETISFLVHKNGDLSDFKIEQSLSPAHDAELIRLIKAGPAWILLKGNKQRARVSLNF